MDKMLYLPKRPIDLILGQQFTRRSDLIQSLTIARVYHNILP